MNFSGKNFLIIGGTSGIGLALVQHLHAGGGQVWVASRHATALPPGVQHLALDVTQDLPADALASIPEALHGLAYCVGSINLKPLQRIGVPEMLQEMELNLFGAVRVVQPLLKNLKKANGASVVLFSTVAATLGMPFHAGIAAAKGAVNGWGKSLAAELAPAGIRVNVLAPSLTDTPMAAALLNTEEKKAASDKRHPLGRVGQPEDLAGIAAFLLSDQAGWITGQIIGVDGGMSTLK